MFIASAMVSSCTDFDWDQNHDTTLTEFDITTQDNTTVVIADDKSNIDEEHTFEWTGSKAADYSQVFYKVVFSLSDDFSNPVYELEPENLGTANTITVTNKTLNIAAERAGIKQLGTGTLKWTVRATNGIATRMSNSIHTMTITRPSGFAYNPDMVNIEGDDMQATAMRKLEDGKFEMFVFLGTGKYVLKELTSTVNRSFGIDGTTLTEDGVITPVVPNSVHHIVVDYNTASASIKAVTEVGLWYSAANDVVAVMEPSLNKTATWSTDYLCEVVKRDYRYKFRLTEKDATGEESTTFYGYSRSVAGYQTASSPATYFYLYPEAKASQSSYCFRFNNTGLHEGKTLRITVDLQPELENYTHSVTVL